MLSPFFYGDSAFRWPLFITSPIRTLKGQREKDCEKNSPMGVCQLGAGFEVVGNREGLALECGREVKTEMRGLEKEAGEAGP